MIILGMNGFAMARHGLILSQNEATSLRNMFKYLPGHQDTILSPKIGDKVKKIPKSKFDFYVKKVKLNF